MHAICRLRASYMSIGVLVLTVKAVCQLGISTEAHAQATTRSTGSSGATPAVRPGSSGAMPAVPPQLRAGKKVNIEGVGAPFSGQHLVPRTTHTFGAGGSTRRRR
jgi:hypothetical protein